LQLIEAATQAPSAVNEQPWSFYVVRDTDRMTRLSDGAKDHLIRTSSMATLALHLRETLADPTHDIFHGAPLLIVIASHVESTWAIEDCALAAQNLMLTAYAMDLGSCWIGSAHAYLQTPAGRAMLGLHTDHRAVAPIVIGHPSGHPQPVPRRPPDVHWIG
jgi:nitroreductase